VNVLAAICAAIFVLSGCGGGNRLIVNDGGKAESGVLVLDSIPQPVRSDEYVIGYGDRLDIVFMFNKDLDQLDVKVRPDGRISLPYVGEVRASGMSPSALDSLLSARFAEIVRDPDITVILREFAPQVVYVLGEVENGGGYPYTRDLTLLGLLAQGRGPNEKGRQNAVLVIRRITPDHIVGIQVNLKDLVGGKRFDLDIPLQPNDIVYVPKSMLSRAADFEETLYKILTTPGDLYIKGWQLSNQKTLYDFYKRSGTAF